MKTSNSLEVFHYELRLFATHSTSQSMTAKQPQSISLSEANVKDTCDHAAKSKGLLLHAFRNGSVEQQSRLAPNIKDLQNLLTLYEIIFSVRKALDETRESLKNWIPKGHIELIVRACCNQQYKEHDVEHIFYNHGDINGLLVFYLGTKGQTTLFPKARALPIEMMVDLAIQCGKEQINSVVSG
jgi:hypothetical protein